MSISNFPTQLQAAIQQGYLAREFTEGLRSRIGFRAVADREVFGANIGETITKTRKGLKAPVTTPLNPSSNTNFDNGLSPSAWAVEQYSLPVNMYGDTIDLNMVTSRVGIASQFLANARTNGVQAMQSVDRLARNTLFGGALNGVGGYLSGNTRVITALGSASSTLRVDDIRGFINTLANGQVTPVSSGNPLATIVNGDAYTVIGATPDATNISTAPGGVSGTLTFSANVAQSDGALNAPVISAVAPAVLRPNGRSTTAGLLAPNGVYGAANYMPGDQLTMDCVNQAVAYLQNNNVPMIDGAYHVYLDNTQMRGLFRDPDFKYLYRGAYQSEEYRDGTVTELLGARFIPTTEAPQQASLGAGPVRRAIMVGQGALVEGDYEGTGYADLPDVDTALMEMVDGVCMVTREPLDRLRQIIAQSWYWIGGFALPTDSTATTSVIPTASNAYLKRGVVLESL